MLGSIGDLLLDVVTVPVGELRAGDDTPSTVRVGGGGQAANFCGWVAALGEPARLITRIGGDRIGRFLADELREAGVDVRAVVGPERTGAIVVVVGPGGERSFATQRGATVQLRPDEVDPSWLVDLRLLHVPAYSLFEEPLASASQTAIAFVRARGGAIAVDLSSAAGIQKYGATRMIQVLEQIRPELLFANESEAAVLGGNLDHLARRAVLKRGARGCAVGDRSFPAPPVDVVDTTGAGDAFAAGFCVSYLRADDPAVAAEAAIRAAARAVTRLGGRP